MDETASQIEHDIKRTRETLGSNLQELEHKVKSATDWKQQFEQHPIAMIGIAFGGGLLLSAMLGGRRSREPRPYTPKPASTSEVKHEALQAFDNIKGALIGVATTRLKDYVSDIIPGFREHFDRSQQKATRYTDNVH